MKKIEPYKLWLGHAGDGRDFKQMLDLGIEALVQLASEEPPVQPPRELIYLRFPLIDGSGKTFNPLHFADSKRRVVNWVFRFLTLVCCGAGLSRSPAVAAAALALAQTSESKN